jgi:hypothetical protein
LRRHRSAAARPAPAAARWRRCAFGLAQLQLVVEASRDALASKLEQVRCAIPVGVGDVMHVEGLRQCA